MTLKKIMENIKSIVSVKSNNSDIPTSTIHDGQFIATANIADSFNNFLNSVVQSFQSEIKFSSKSIEDFFPPNPYSQ